MAIAIVQQQDSVVASATSVSVTMGALTNDNYLIAVLKDLAAATTFTMPSGWAHVNASPYSPSVTRTVLIAYKKIAGDSTTVTFSAGTATNKYLKVFEVSGIDLTNPIDTGFGTSGTTTTTVSATATSRQMTAGTTSVTPAFVVAVAEQAAGNGGEVSINQSFTTQAPAGFISMMIGTRVLTSTATVDPTFTWTTTRTSFGFMAAFRGAAVDVAFTRPVTATIAAGAATAASSVTFALPITVNRAAAATLVKTVAFTRGITASIVAAASATSPTVATATNDDVIPHIQVWDDLGSGVWGLVGEVSDFVSLTIEPKFLQEGSWDMEVPDEDGDRLSVLTPDRLYTMDWRGVRTTWRLDTWNPSSNAEGEKTLQVGGPSALGVLGFEQAWPDPSLGIGSQPDPGDRYGPDDAETVIRDLVNDNYIVRRGGDLNLETNAHNGADVRARGRFDSLLELVVKKAKVGGVGVDVQLVNTSSVRAELHLVIWTPEDKSGRVELSEQLGSVSEWNQSNQAPTATKAVVSGAGGTHQVVTTPESIAAATAWGGHRVIYVPLPDTYDADDQTQAGEEALKDGAATTNVSLSATDTEGTMAFTHYNVGDKVTGLLESGLDAVDVITSIKVEITDGAPEITSTFGDPSATDPIFSMAELIRNQDRRLRQVEQRS